MKNSTYWLAYSELQLSTERYYLINQSYLLVNCTLIVSYSLCRYSLIKEHSEVLPQTLKYPLG